MTNQEAYDIYAHYDPVAAAIVEPIDILDVNTLNVTGEITCFKINLDEIVDADGDVQNGITFEGDLFMADNSTIQLATVQGVAGAAVDFIDDIAFDTNSGITFGTGDKLDEYVEDTFVATFSGAITGTDTWKYVKIGSKVTLQFIAFGGATTPGSGITVSGIPAAIRPPASWDVKFMVDVTDNAAHVLGTFSIGTAGTAVFLPFGAASFSGPGSSGFGSHAVSYIV